MTSTEPRRESVDSAASHAEGPPADALAPGIDEALRVQALALVVALLGPCLVSAVGLQGTDRLDGNAVFHLVATQEPTMLAVGLVALVVCAAVARDSRPAGDDPPPAKAVPALAGVAAMLGWVGWRWVSQRYLLSGDEFTADWEARTLLRGSITAAVPEALRGVGAALTAAYSSYVPDAGVIRGGYLPGHSAFRALWIALGDGSLTNPVLNVVGVLAVAQTLRQLCPDRPRAALVGAAFAAASAQVVFGGMTAYAMPGYFALHAVWMALWTGPGRRPYAAALVGAVLMGWHNPVMHPLWAAPFLLGSLRRRDHRLLGWTLAVYAVAGAGWLQAFLGLRDGVEAVGGGAPGLFGWPDGMRLVTQASYLTLLVTWQAPLTIGLAVAALRRWRALPPVLKDAATSLGLTWLFFCFFREPQGNGWGYRYVHGHLGTLALLAGWGAAGLRWNRGLQRALVTAVVLSLGALIPIRAVQVRAYVAPFAATDAWLSSQPPDTALLIDPLEVWYGVDLARNDPALTPPLRLNMRRTGPSAVGALIADGTPVRRVTKEELTRFGLTAFAP